MCLSDLGVHRTGVYRAGIAGWDGIIIASTLAVVAVMFMRTVVVMRVFTGLILGHQVHAAFGAIARPVLTHLWMHWADIKGCVVIGVGVVLVVFHVFGSVENSFWGLNVRPIGVSTVTDIA